MSPREQLKIFYSADVHGSDVAFRKWVNSADVFKPDVLLMGGDLTGKFVVPIVRLAGGMYQSEFYGPNAFTEEELAAYKKRLRASGKYWAVLDPEEKAGYDAEPDRVQGDLFRPLVEQNLREWMELLAERVDLRQTRICMMLGNDDDPALGRLLDDYECVEHVDDRVTDLGQGYHLVSLGYSNETPWHTAREMGEEELTEHLEALFREVPEGGETVLNVHVPPSETSLDQAALLDENLRPRLQGGNMLVGGVGSTAVRQAIEGFQPVLGLHGHIHESSGSQKLGGTFAINPGSEYTEGVLRGALVVLERGRKVRSWQLIHG